jgi:hypothetical protein
MVVDKTIRLVDKTVMANDKTRPPLFEHLGQPGIGRRFSAGDASPPAKPIAAKEAIARVEAEKKSKIVAKKSLDKGGRPSTTGKPWEALGISRQAYYKRKAKESHA